MDYFTIKNWRKYQHYKNRNDPWIKVHNSILNDYDFSRLSNDSKLMLMHIWVLATSFGVEEPKIPNDSKWISEKCNLKGKFCLKELFSYGFIILISIDSRKIRNCIGSNQININNINNINKKDKKPIDHLTENDPFSRENFELIWKLYPLKKGKEKSFLKFKAQVKSEKDWADMQIALQAYIVETQSQQANGHPDLQYQHGSTWFNHNWKDYIDFKPAKETTWAERMEAKKKNEGVF